MSAGNAPAKSSIAPKLIWSYSRHGSNGANLLAGLGILLSFLAAGCTFVASQGRDLGGVGVWFVAAILLVQSTQYSALKRQLMSIEEAIREAHQLPFEEK